MTDRIQRRGRLRFAGPPEGWFEGAQAVLSLRDGGVSEPPFDSLNVGSRAGDDPAAVEENERKLAGALRLAAAPARIRLEHGPRCAIVDAPGIAGAADGMLTRRAGLPLWLTVADCHPVFLAAGEAIALLHCGWRGVAAGIIEEAAVRLAALAECSPSTFRVWIGPGIGACCYPVGAEVASRFDPDLAPLAGGLRRLDLRAAITRRLVGLGVAEGSILASRLCTSCRGDLFFSFRRDGARSGRMAAVFAR